MLKATPGVDVLLGSLQLSLIDFSTGASVAEVSTQTIRNYGIAYVILLPIGMWLGAFVLSRYRSSRSDHAATLEALRARGFDDA